MKKIIIIGAGISGLSAAWRLSEAGYTTHVLESDKQIGGLAKSIKIDDYILDIGPIPFLLKIKKFMKKL